MNQPKGSPVSQVVDSPNDQIHTFSFKAIDPKADQSKNVIVSFTPLTTQFGQVSITPKLLKLQDSQAPMFGNPYYHTLLLNHQNTLGQRLSSRSWLSKTPQSQRLSHGKADSQKPRPNSKYCQICKEKFTDYIEHIKHQIHINKIKNNPFGAYLQNLITEFQIMTKKQKKSSSSWSKNKDDTDSIHSFQAKKKLKVQKQASQLNLQTFKSVDISTASSTLHTQQIKKPFAGNL